MPHELDPTWESTSYKQGRGWNRWPYDIVVSFVFRHRPRDRAPGETRILEVGCGGGNNLWFAAREGFKVAGIDGSTAAIDAARRRFVEEKLEADLRVGDMRAELPWPDASFDLAVDRGALTCCGHEGARLAVAQLRRVVRPGGKVFLSPYSDEHSSAKGGVPGPDGLVTQISRGTLAGIGQLGFFGRGQVEKLVQGWRVLALEHVVATDLMREDGVHAEWRVVAERVP